MREGEAKLREKIDRLEADNAEVRRWAPLEDAMPAAPVLPRPIIKAEASLESGLLHCSGCRRVDAFQGPDLETPAP